MQQIQALVDRVRSALADEAVDSTPEMKKLADEFYSECRTLNERLRRCEDYLRRGLRAEAIQEAEADPRLLDAVGILQSLTSEEWINWIERTQFLELKVPEQVLVNIAEMLDEAYNEHAPIEQLLRTHRKLALQRAPLSRRLSHLRKLFKKDPNSEIWRDDLRKYETDRLEEIKGELKALRRSLSLETCQELYNEVKDASWLIQLPPSLIPTLSARLQEAVREDARQRLRTISDVLHGAFSSMNVIMGRKAYQDWQMFLPLADLDETDPLVFETLPAIGWCEQRLAAEAENTAWEDHLHEVNLALDREPADEVHLRRLYDKTSRLQRPLPPAVESRLAGRITGIEEQGRRRRILIGSGATIATIGFVAAIVLLVTSMQDKALRKDVIARIRAHVEAGELKLAEDLRDKYLHSWEQAPEWGDASSQVDQLAVALADREHQVEMLLNQADTVSETDEAGFRRLITEATGITEKSPPLPELKKSIDRRIQKMEIGRMARLKEREEDVSTRLSAQGKKVEELKSSFTKLSSKDFDDEVERIRDGLGAIAAELPGLTSRLTEQHKFLSSEIHDVQRRFARTQRRTELLSRLQTRSRIQASQNSLNELQTFTELLGTFTKDLEDDPLTPGIKQAIGEHDLWRSLYAVREFPQSTSRLFPISAEGVSERKSAAEEFLKQHPRTPHNKTLRNYLEVLGVLELRYKPATGLLHLLSDEIMETESMRDLYVLRNTKLSWPYYVVSRTTLEGKTTIEFKRWSALEKSETIKILSKDLQSLSPAPAPQAALLKAIQAQINELTAENWDRKMSEIVRAVVIEEQVDPILRMQLLASLCALAKSGSLQAPKHKPFLDFEATLTRKIENINLLTDWADPRSKEVNDRRNLCQEYLKDTSTLDFTKVWPTSTEADIFRQIQLDLSVPIVAVGWMRPEADGKPGVDVVLPDGTWTLTVAIPGETGIGRLENLGQFEQGKLKLYSTATTLHYVPGRLVFARQATSVQPSSN